MIDVFLKRWRRDWGHVTPAEILLCLDGELHPEAARKIQAHLDNCWSCRAESLRIDATIAGYVHYRNHLLGSMVNPPETEERFQRKLRTAGAVTPPRLRFPIAPRWAVAVLCFLGAIGIFWWRIGSSPSVSAAEVLALVEQTEARRLRAIEDPVVHQRLLIRRRRTGVSSLPAEPIETWTGMPTGTFHEEGHGAYREALLAVLEENQLRVDRLLDGRAYRQWRGRASTERVDSTAAHDGTPVLRLTAHSQPPPESGRIVSASLAVRSTDWHPIEENFRVQREGWTEEFEVVELAYNVVPRRDLDLELSRAIGQAPEKPVAVISPRPAAPVAPEADPPASVSELEELEVDLHYALHRIQACHGEAVSVTRAAGDRRLLVEGILDNPRRRDQLAAALASWASSPSVTIRLLTPAGILPPSLERVTDLGPRTYLRRVPLEERLLGGATPDQAATLPASWMQDAIGLSDLLLSEVWAVRRLGDAFPAERLQALPPRSAWLIEAMLNDHLETAQSVLVRLNEQMRQVPGWAPAPYSPESSSPRTLTWLETVLVLLESTEQMNGRLSGLITAPFVTNEQTDQALAALGLALPAIESRLSDLHRQLARQLEPLPGNRQPNQ